MEDMRPSMKDMGLEGGIDEVVFKHGDGKKDDNAGLSKHRRGILPKEELPPPHDITEQTDDTFEAANNLGIDLTGGAESEEPIVSKGKAEAIPLTPEETTPKIIATFDTKTGGDLRPVQAVEGHDKTSQKQISKIQLRGQIPQGALDRLESKRGPINNVGDLGPEEIARARREIPSHKVAQSSVEIVRNSGQDEGGGEREATLQPTSQPETQTAEANLGKREPTSFTVEAGGAPELSDKEKSELAEKAIKSTNTLNKNPEELSSVTAQKALEQAAKNGFIKEEDGKYYAVVPKGQTFLEAYNQKVEIDDKVEIIEIPPVSEKRAYMQSVETRLGADGIPDDIAEFLREHSGHQHELIDLNKRIEALPTDADQERQTLEGERDSLKGRILALEQGINDKVEELKRDREFAREWLIRGSLPEESKIETIKKAASGETDLSELIVRADTPYLTAAYRDAAERGLLVRKDGKIIAVEGNEESQKSYDYLFNLSRAEITKQDLLEAGPKENVQEKLSTVYRGSINELLQNAGNTDYIETAVDLIKASHLVIDKNGEIKIAEHDGEQDKVGLDRIQTIKTEAKQNIEQEYLARELDPDHLKDEARKFIGKEPLGEKMHAYILEKSRMAEPPKRGFLSRAYMAHKQPKAYEKYLEEKQSYKDARRELRQVGRMERTWVAQEQKLRKRAIEFESELRGMAEKIESGEMSKREWRSLRNKANKLYVRRDNINKLLARTVATQIGYEGDMPGLANWEGLSPSDIMPETENDEIRNIIEGVNYDTRSWLAEKLGIDALSAKDELAEEYRALFRIEQAGESIRDLAISRVSQKALSGHLMRELVSGELDNPGRIYQLLGAIKDNQFDMRKCQEGVDTQLNAYTYKKFFKLASQEMKLHFKRAFNIAITNAGEDFEVTLDTRISELLDRGERLVFTTPINFFRRSALSAGIGGRYIKYGYDWVTNTSHEMFEKMVPEAAVATGEVNKWSDALYETSAKLKEVRERAAELAEYRKVAFRGGQRKN